MATTVIHTLETTDTGTTRSSQDRCVIEVEGKSYIAWDMFVGGAAHTATSAQCERDTERDDDEKPA